MDPQRPSKNKDGNWNFPEGVSFPVDARVMIKLYKVAETGGGDGEGRGQTKFLNTKVMKAEVSFSKEDLFSKASVLEAIERDCEVKKWLKKKALQILKLNFLSKDRILGRFSL